MKIVSYNVHGWYDENGVYNLHKIVELYRELRPDFMCMQEITGHGLNKFMEDTGLKHSLKWESCAIVSNRELVDWISEQPKQRNFHPRFITAKVLTDSLVPFYITCLHLDHRAEPTRMKELEAIEQRLKSLFKEKSPQVWLGDFNSLTEGDYMELEWEEVTNVRKNNSWESPKTQVTSRMVELGFQDSWTLAGKPQPTSTCRFNTHIDYVFINKEFRDLFKLEAVLHHPSKASDHQLVMATFTDQTN